MAEPTYVLVRGAGTSSRYSRHYQAPQDLAAWACVAHDNPYGYMTEPEFADSLLPGLAGLNVGDPETLGAGRANYRTTDPELLAALHRLIEEGDKLTPENPYRVRSLDSSHAGFVLRAAEVADILTRSP